MDTPSEPRSSERFSRRKTEHEEKTAGVKKGIPTARSVYTPNRESLAAARKRTSHGLPATAARSVGRFAVLAAGPDLARETLPLPDPREWESLRRGKDPVLIRPDIRQVHTPDVGLLACGAFAEATHPLPSRPSLPRKAWLRPPPRWTDRRDRVTYYVTRWLGRPLKREEKFHVLSDTAVERVPDSPGGRVHC